MAAERDHEPTDETWRADTKGKSDERIIRQAALKPYRKPDPDPTPDGWDEWLRLAALTPAESASILDELLTRVGHSSSVPPGSSLADRIGRQVAFATRSLRPFAERHRIFTDHLSGR